MEFSLHFIGLISNLLLHRTCSFHYIASALLTFMTFMTSHMTSHMEADIRIPLLLHFKVGMFDIFCSISTSDIMITILDSPLPVKFTVTTGTPICYPNSEISRVAVTFHVSPRIIRECMISFSSRSFSYS